MLLIKTEMILLLELVVLIAVVEPKQKEIDKWYNKYLEENDLYLKVTK